MHSAEGNDAAWPLKTSDGGMYATWSPHQDPCFYDRFRLLRREFGDEGQSISDALGRLAVAPLTAAYQAGRPISVLSIGAGDGTVDEPLYRTLAAVSGGRPLVYHAAEPVGTPQIGSDSASSRRARRSGGRRTRFGWCRCRGARTSPTRSLGPMATKRPRRSEGGAARSRPSGTSS